MKQSNYLRPRSYINFLMRIVFSIISPFVRIWERQYIQSYAAKELKHQPVFIIGAPRTGSTILYQILSNQLDVTYVDNLICRFHRNFFAGCWLSDKVFKQRAHDCFTSENGDTSSSGLRAPSECGEFWYRWLPSDRHFLDDDEIKVEMVEGIRQEITAVINYFDKPILFKNLNAGQRLRLLHQCFPYAKFIVVNREPLYTAQSILLAKRKLGLADSEFWSIMPRNVDKLRPLSAYEQITKQIYFLKRQIYNDQKLFSDNSFLEVEYSDLENEFGVIQSRCRSFIGADARSKYVAPDINIVEKRKLDDQEISNFETEIEKLDWVNYRSEQSKV